MRPILLLVSVLLIVPITNGNPGRRKVIEWLNEKTNSDNQISKNALSDNSKHIESKKVSKTKTNLERQCPEDFIKLPGLPNCYLFETRHWYTWVESNLLCKQRGGYLLEPESDFELAMVKLELIKKRYKDPFNVGYWLGISNMGLPWRFLTTTTVQEPKATDWLPGYPSEMSPSCVLMSDDYKHHLRWMNTYCIEHEANTICRAEPFDCEDGKCPVNGGWSEWTQLGSCSVPCGNGMAMYGRKCNNPEPLTGGQECIGESFETKPCSNGPCQDDVAWSSWTSVSGCSKSCGGGTQFFVRVCKNPPNGEKDCEGPSEMQKPCNVQPCPIDGNWSPWVSEPCSASCGVGSRKVRRRCDSPKPEFGGKDCEGSEDTKVEECITNTCPGILFIASGFPVQKSAIPAFVDLTTKSTKNCSNISAMPVKQSGMIAMLHEDGPLLCGGQSRQTNGRRNHRECYQFSIEDNSWANKTLLDVRLSWGTAVMINKTHWWITGGHSGGKTISTTRVYNSLTGAIKPYVNLPEDLDTAEHLLVQLNSTHTFLINGKGRIGNKTFIFDHDKLNWQEMDSTLVNHFAGFAGLIQKQNGESEVIASGGWEGGKVTEIFSFETLKWRNGPAMPISNLGYGVSMQYFDSFLIAGGNGDGVGRQDMIYFYDPRSEEWIKLRQTLDSARSSFVGMLVPDNYLDMCTM